MPAGRKVRSRPCIRNQGAPRPTRLVPATGTQPHETIEPDSATDDGVHDLHLFEIAADMPATIISAIDCWDSGGTEVCHTTHALAGDGKARTLRRHRTTMFAKLANDPIDPT